MCRVPQKPCSCLFPLYAPISGWETGICTLQCPGSFCAGIYCSWGCRATGKQGIAFCLSTPPQAGALSRMPKPNQCRSWRALTPHQHGSVSLDCALASTPILPSSLCGICRSCPSLPMAKEGLEQVLTLGLPQCVTGTWFSEREERRVLSAIACREGNAELASEPWLCAPCTLFCMECLSQSRLSPGIPTHSVTPSGCITLSWATGKTVRGVLLLAVPAGCCLGTGALATLLVADILPYLVDSPVPTHRVRGKLEGITGTDLLL